MGGSKPAAYSPVEMPDSLISKDTAVILDVLCEGPIQGFVHGETQFRKDVYFDNTPVVASDGTVNFSDFVIDTRTGEQNQVPMQLVKDVEVVVVDGREIIEGTPLTFSITDTDTDKVRITFSVPTMVTVSAKGDRTGAYVEIQVFVKQTAGSYSTVPTITEIFNGKTTSGYIRSSIVPLLGDGPWTVKVVRVTPTSETESLVDNTYLASYTRIYDLKLSYPNTALVGLQIPAKSFSAPPTRTFDILGMLVAIPDNYTPRVLIPGTPDTYTPASYTGTWGGTFAAAAWTDNPAWCFYDLLTNERYGLGKYLAVENVDKFALYTIARYCDEMVPDGKGGYEPRFTFNGAINSQEEAYKVVQDFAAMFRAMTFWSNNTVFTIQDKPTDPSYLFSPSNIVEGSISYAGSSLRSRHNVVQVAWNDPSDAFKQKFAYVEDQESISRMGRVVQTDIVAMGCTSEAQAVRLGRWLLYTEKYETEVVSFRSALEGILIRPGDVIQLSDPHRIGTRRGGRIASATTTTVTLDDDIFLASGETYDLAVVLEDGSLASRPITNTLPYYGRVIEAAFAEPPGYDAQWQLTGSDGYPTLYRVLSVMEETEKIFQINAMLHVPEKYDLVEETLELEDPIGNDLPVPTTLRAPTGLTLGEYMYISGEAVKTTLTASWTRATGARGYRVEWTRGDGNWQPLPDVTTNFAEVRNVEPAPHKVRVFALYLNDLMSSSVEATYTVVGKTALPEIVTGFTANVQDGSIVFRWTSVNDLDLDGYEIRRGAAPSDWEDALLPLFTKANSKVIDIPDTGTYRYFIKAKDTSGNYSLNATSLDLVLAKTDSVDTLSVSGKKEFTLWWEEYQNHKTEAERLLGIFDANSNSKARDVKALFDSALTAITTFFSTRTTPYAWDVFTGPTDLGSGGGASLRALKITVIEKWILLNQALGYLQIQNTLSGGVADAVLQANFLDPLTGLLPANTLVTTGSITSPLIAANSIFTRQLYITDFNSMIPNGSSEIQPPTGAWGATDTEGQGIHSGDAFQGSWCRRALSGETFVVSKQETTAKADDQHYFRAMIKTSGTAVLGIDYWTGASWVSGGTQSTTSATYVKVELTSSAAPSGTSQVRVSISSSGGTSYFDDLYAHRLGGGELLVDGAVITRTLAAESITAEKLEAELILASIIRSTGYVAGTTGAPPTGFKLSGEVFTSTLTTGATLDVNMEIGSSINMGGYQVAAYAGRTFGQVNRISNGKFNCYLVGWPVVRTGSAFIEDGQTSGGKAVARILSTTTSAESLNIYQSFYLPGEPVEDIDFSFYTNTSALNASAYLTVKLYRLSDGDFYEYGFTYLSATGTTTETIPKEWLTQGNYGIGIFFASPAACECVIGEIELVM